MESEQHFTVELTLEELHGLVKAIMFANGFERPDEAQMPALREVAARLLRIVAEERTGPIAVTIVPRGERLAAAQSSPDEGLDASPVLTLMTAPRERA